MRGSNSAPEAALRTAEEAAAAAVSGVEADAPTPAAGEMVKREVATGEARTVARVAARSPGPRAKGGAGRGGMRVEIVANAQLERHRRAGARTAVARAPD